MGKDPIFDHKIDTLHHPLWQEFCRLSQNYKFDGRLERYNDETVISIMEGGAMEQIRLLNPIEAELLKQEEKRQQKEYEEEFKVAQVTGKEIPEPPEPPMMSITLQQLANFVHSIEEEVTFPDSEVRLEDLEDYVVEVAQEMYGSVEDFEAYPMAAVLQNYSEKEEIESKEEQKEELIVKIEEGQNQISQKLLLITKLSEYGFSMEQIHVLKPFLLELSYEQMTKFFRPQMSIEKMKMILEILKT